MNGKERLDAYLAGKKVDRRPNLTIVGSVVYRIIIAVAIKTNLFPTYFLKFVSVFIIAVALSVKPMRNWLSERKNRQRRMREAAKGGAQDA